MINTFVIDTNVLISAFLNPNSKPFLAFRLAREKGEIVFSPATFSEFKKLLFHSKFDKYLSKYIRYTNLNIVEKVMKLVTPTEIITICRDPRDNKFLELAVSCQATCIVSGDSDLLVLHPFRNIPIMTPSDFLDNY